jgi:hypothetical protein
MTDAGQRLSTALADRYRIVREAGGILFHALLPLAPLRHSLI